MALYGTIKALIDDNIYSNDVQYITGDIHNDVMNELVDQVGAAQIFGPVAVSYNPGTPQNPQAYLLYPGTYPNFSGIVVTAPLGLAKWDGTVWTVTQLEIGSSGGGNPLRCQTTAALTATTTITSIAIEDVNSLGWNAFAGQWVKLTNRETGVFDFVQLTADLEPADTSMSVDSYTLQQSFPIGSIVECYPVLNMREWGKVFIVGGGSDYINVDSDWRMIPVEGVNSTVYLELLEVTKDGLQCEWTNGAATEEWHYEIDSADRTKFIFNDILPAGTRIRIKYKQPAVL